MGNYVSCTLAQRNGSYSKDTKVIFPNGEIHKFQDPINAAEPMLESPNSFVVNSKYLRIGARIAPETVPTPPRLNMKDITGLSSPEFKRRITMCRSKKPILDTIAEEHVCSR
nr:hypothetical protein [Tanacetum cinerariifolium]